MKKNPSAAETRTDISSPLNTHSTNHDNTATTTTTGANDKTSDFAAVCLTTMAVNHAHSGSKVDICLFFRGWWKRQLEWRTFGGNHGSFDPVRTSNTVVYVEEIMSMKAEQHTRYLQWSFGRELALDQLNFGYVLRFLTPRGGDMEDSSGIIIDWQYNGRKCSGMFQPNTGTTVLNFFLAHTTVVITYRIIDWNTAAVCIVEVEQGRVPTVQTGVMMRVAADRHQHAKATASTATHSPQ